MGMKIGTIADLHIDRHNKKTSEDYLEALVEIVKYKNLDILLIAGYLKSLSIDAPIYNAIDKTIRYTCEICSWKP